MRFLSILIVSFTLIINPTLAATANEVPETRIYEARHALKECEKKTTFNFVCLPFK